MIKILNLQISVLRSSLFRKGLKDFRNCPSCLSRFSSTKESHSASEAKLNEDDAIEVYYGVMTPKIRGVKVFSLISSLGCIAAQPLLFKQIEQSGGGLPMLIAVGSFLGFFTFASPFLLHIIARKYVTQIYYHPKDDNYSLTTLSFFLRRQTMKFKPEDVEIPDLPGMFTSFTVKGKPVLVDSRLFLNHSHYIKIMGYDKPLDFHLGKPEDNLAKDDKKQ